MGRTERAVVYSLLAILLAVNLVPLVTSFSGVEANADALAAPLEDPTLGPASALVLSGDKGDLRLENRGKRLAWGKDASARAYSVAFVNVGKVLTQLRMSASFRDEADTLKRRQEENEADYRKRLEEITGRLEQMERGSDEFNRLYEEGGALYREFMDWGSKAFAERERLAAAQIERAYKEVVAAVDVVCDRLNIDMVYRFIPTNDPFESENFEGAITEVRLRTVLRYPEGLDITSDILRELNLKDE